MNFNARDINIPPDERETMATSEEEKKWRFERVMWPLFTLLLGGVIGGLSGFFTSQLAIKDDIANIHKDVGEFKADVNRELGIIDGANRELKNRTTNVSNMIDGAIAKVAKFETDFPKLEKRVVSLNKQITAHEKTLDIIKGVTSSPETLKAIEEFTQAPPTEKNLLVEATKKLKSVTVDEKGQLLIDANMTILGPLTLAKNTLNEKHSVISHQGMTLFRKDGKIGTRLNSREISFHRDDDAEYVSLFHKDDMLKVGSDRNSLIGKKLHDRPIENGG